MRKEEEYVRSKEIEEKRKKIKKREKFDSGIGDEIENRNPFTYQ
jgi:hypothetical protein